MSAKMQVRESETRPGKYITIGGTQKCLGGTEIFLQRLAALWPATNLGPLLVLPANTAWLTSSRSVLLSASIWLAGIVRITACIATRVSRQRMGVTVWYHYSNAIDLASILWITLIPGVRVFVTPHCSLTWRHLSRPISRQLSLYVLKRVSGILVLSEEQRQVFTEAKVPVARIRTLIPARPRNSLPFHQRRPGSFVFAGRVTRDKGIAQMVEMMRSLCHQSPIYTLDIFGKIDPDMAALLRDEAARDPTLGRAIRIRGPVAPEQMARELGSYRYLLHLSKVDAFPLAVLEAITAGTVPVVFELPGTSEMIDVWGGISAPTDDIEALVRAVLAVECSGGNARLRSDEAVDYYSPDAVAREIRATMEASCA